MNPDEKQMLQESLELSRQNNAMLHSMRRIQKWASFMRIVYWILIIAVSYGAYKYTEPYLNKAMQIFQSTQTDLNSLKSITGQFKLK